MPSNSCNRKFSEGLRFSNAEMHENIASSSVELALSYRLRLKGSLLGYKMKT